MIYYSILKCALCGILGIIMFLGVFVGWTKKKESTGGPLFGLRFLIVGMLFSALGVHNSVFANNLFESKPSVVVTIKPLALIVSELTGEDFTLTTLLPPSANPHALSMSIKDRQVLAEAQLVVWLGGRFERFLAKPMAQNQKAQLELGALPELSWPGQPQDDLHLWLDVANVKVVLQALAPQLIALAPLKAPVIQERLSKSLAKLDQTHLQIQAQLALLSHQSFVVSHDGYGHFVNAYGLKQSAAASKLPEDQLSARKMVQLKHVQGDPSCLIAEPNERAGARLAAALSLPLVLADPLGRDDHIEQISALLLALAKSFEVCLSKSS